MTLTTLRDRVRRALSSGGSTSRYDATDIDDSIQEILPDFVRRTKCTRTVSSLTLVLNSSSVDLSALTGFRPEFVLESGIYVVADSNYSAHDCRKPLREVEIAEILRERDRVGTSSGVPYLIAFDSNTPTTATIYPAAKAAGTLKIIWSAPFVSFTAGTTSPDSVTINIPDDIVLPCVQRIAIARQANEKEMIPNRQEKLAAYESHVLRCMGTNGLGAKSFQRTSLDKLRYARW